MPTVLLIEDELSLGLIVRDSLEVRGFTVFYASDGEDGHSLFVQHRPDIVVADVVRGFELGGTIT